MADVKSCWLCGEDGRSGKCSGVQLLDDLRFRPVRRSWQSARADLFEGDEMPSRSVNPFLKDLTPAQLEIGVVILLILDRCFRVL